MSKFKDELLDSDFLLEEIEESDLFINDLKEKEVKCEKILDNQY